VDELRASVSELGEATFEVADAYRPAGGARRH
jgi:hypothetical protein